MKIYAVADIHGFQYRLNLVLKNIETYTPDLVVLCGDITQFGPSEVALNFLNQISLETLAIPGNIDSVDVDEGISQSHAKNLHKRLIRFHDIPFVGIGGNLPVAVSDVAICVDKGNKPLHTLIDKRTVLVTHVPPYGLQDRIFLGSHGGSKELRALIEEKAPRLVLCGHIHENPGVSSLGTTTVVNCSMGKRTEGALVEISDDIHVTMLE